MNKVAMALLVLGLVGCVQMKPYQSYAGQPLPDTEQVRIIGHANEGAQMWNPIRPTVTLFYCFDGKSLRAPQFSQQPYLFPAEILTTPGRHIVGVFHGAKAAHAYTTLWLEAEPGHRYRVEKRFEGYSVIFYFVDQETGKTVGGLAGDAMADTSSVEQCTNDLDP